MGRPLFSRSHESPAVRVEPEQTQPAYDRWSYWNPFDPDSEEFFADAVDEHVSPPEESDGRDETILVEEINSSSSEGTSSGRETPVFADDSLSIEEINLAARQRVTERQRALIAIGATGATPPRTPEEEGQTYRAVQRPVYSGYPSPRTATSYVRTPYRTGQTSRSLSPIPRTEVAIEPVSISRPAPTRSAPITIPARPSTPPNQISHSYGTPSPAPSVTPRLYTWRPPAATSPGSPLPNRNARMSVAHISPSVITVQRVVG